MVCNSVFIGTQKFNFDQYGIINTDFGYVQQLDNTIRVINITKIDMPVNCPCGNCKIITKKINPWDTIYNIPAEIYGDIIRFKKAGWKNIKIITCNETKNKLPIVRLTIKLYKKHFNVRKYILPFVYIKYKTNINVISHSNKEFEFILYEEGSTIPKLKCCFFDYDLTDNKAVYILMLIISAQNNGDKMWHTFYGRNKTEYVSFKI